MLPFEGMLGQIEVEIDGLKSVATAMRSELDSGLRSQAVRVSEAMQPGASIGGPLAGSEFVELQNKLSTWMQGTVDALTNLDLGTVAVAQAAEHIARLYGDSDGFAEARAADVQGLLQATPTSVNPSTPTGTDPRG